LASLLFTISTYVLSVAQVNRSDESNVTFPLPLRERETSCATAHEVGEG
jgi:hypothetical protein